MKKVLIISGHPDLKNSTANKKILEVLAEKLPDAKIEKLDELYPDYKFDVAQEQKSLEAADVIVFQFPFHWYDVPGILKLYIDKIFLHGWSYGSKGKALEGKTIIFSTTTGAPDSEYRASGAFEHEVKEFMYNLRRFAILCNMTPLEPIISCGMMYVPEVSPKEQRDLVIAKAESHAQKIIKTIESL